MLTLRQFDAIGARPVLSRAGSARGLRRAPPRVDADQIPLRADVVAFTSLHGLARSLLVRAGMQSDDYLSRLRAGLAVGNVPDLVFDEFLSPMARSRSRQFWTPIRVAQRAALRLAERGARRVLDVGSGPGKFCIVAACARPEVQFRGVEHRAALVESAGALAQRLRIANLEFSRGDALAVDWHGFDGLYFFNPFAENSFASEDVFDATVELSAPRLASELLRSTQLLSSVREIGRAHV